MCMRPEGVAAVYQADDIERRGAHAQTIDAEVNEAGIVSKTSATMFIET
jgi:hypothetical protein